eukprot:CAMPEP_0196742842 /NCGR_PEP_ID=MMETSP1091-20130531/49045_1 /TAXON_ID=302021 /ORGANISM="Rhodomonas sp., Strain CCMP768" /LENGTH=95 /DNA_ID=CAMNT_0042089007 /DNA_START=45 /DNA_END=332 /DNA_ORIENTATION=+
MSSAPPSRREQSLANMSSSSTLTDPPLPSLLKQSPHMNSIMLTGRMSAVPPACSACAMSSMIPSMQYSPFGFAAHMMSSASSSEGSPSEHPSSCR